MDLKSYLNKTKEKAYQFALRAGVPQPTISRIINRKFTPRLETALLIEEASNGEVTLYELDFSKDKKIKKGI